MAVLRRALRRLAGRPETGASLAARVQEATASGTRVIVFEADWYGLYPFVAPLVNRCAELQDCLVVVMTRASEVAELRRRVRADVIQGSRNCTVFPIEALGSALLRPTLLVSCQPYSTVAPHVDGCPKVQVLHGIADKRGMLFGPRQLSDFTHLFSPAPVVTRLAEERLPALGKELVVVPTGCPKTDTILDGTFNRDQVLASLRLDPARPSVLYAPTWEKEASFEQWGLEIISALAGLPVSVLVKLHPLTLADQDNPHLRLYGHRGRDWSCAMADIESQFANVRWVRSPDANPTLVAADVLVSEGSGIAFEFVLLDKPLVIVDTPAVYQRYGRHVLHHRLRECGRTVSAPELLAEAVQESLANAALYADQRRALIGQLAYNPGRATYAAMEQLLAMIG